MSEEEWDNLYRFYWYAARDITAPSPAMAQRIIDIRKVQDKVKKEFDEINFTPLEN